MGWKVQREPDHSEGASSQKIGRRTGHSQKVVPGLEAFNHVGSAKPGPSLRSGPASDMGWTVQREPDHSEGAPSQKIGRELEASSIGSMCKREPERSEGSGANVPELFSFFWR